MSEMDTAKFHELLLKHNFNDMSQNSNSEFWFTKEIKVSFVNLSETYNSEWESAYIKFDPCMFDPKLYEKSIEFLETIKQSATKNFSDFGAIDLTDVENGVVYIKPNERKPLIDRPDYATAVNVFIQDTKHIFEK
jgi:hypothetical protein